MNKCKGNERIARRYFTRVIAFIVVIALVCALTAFAASPEVYNVDIYDGNVITRVPTSRTVPAEIAMQANITVNEDDILDTDRFNAGLDSIIIVLRAANAELVTPDGNTKKVRFAGTVGDLLKFESIELGDSYKVNYSLDVPLKDGMKVVIDRAYTVYINDGGVITEYKSGNSTVANLLSKVGIELGEDDEVIPSANSAVSDGLVITVNRVKYSTRQEDVTVKYSEKKVNSSELYTGTSKITQKGSDGLKKVTYKDRYVNGQLESSSVLNEVMVKSAVDQIKAVGTKDKPLTVSSVGYKNSTISELAVPSRVQIKNGVPVNYKRVITGKASAYSEPQGSITASGRAVKPGYIAVDPSQFPYGTELWIVSDDGIVYGYCIAADTGGFVNKGKFTVDLFMNSEAQCTQWGSRNVTIYVL